LHANSMSSMSAQMREQTDTHAIFHMPVCLVRKHQETYSYIVEGYGTFVRSKDMFITESKCVLHRTTTMRVCDKQHVCDGRLPRGTGS